MENKFTQLDNDFITLWSYYLLTGTLSGKMVAIKQLAKMGQVNAIQAWYQFNDIGACHEIDIKLNNLEKGELSYEILNAAASYDKCDRSQQNEFKALIKRMSTVLRDYHETCQITKEQFEEDTQAIRDSIADIPFIAKQEKATKWAFSEAKQTEDLYTFERANELLLAQAPFCLTQKQRKALSDKVKNNNKELVRSFSLQFVKNLTEDRFWTAEKDPQFAFNFAKSIKLFKDPKKTQSLDNLATKILGTLSQRELSPELLDALYEEEHVVF